MHKAQLSILDLSDYTGVPTTRLIPIIKGELTRLSYDIIIQFNTLFGTIKN